MNPLLFLNTRGHVFNNGEFALNLGLGGRVTAPSKKWTVGLNGYYDYQSSSVLSPSQLGGGFELFISDYVLRFNGYAPIGTVKKTEGKRAAVALANLQGEVEKVLLTGEIHQFSGAIGAYYLTGRAFENRTFGKAWGSEIRASVQLWQWVELLFETTYDQIFDFTFQGIFALTIPIGSRKKKLSRPIIRREIVPLEKKKL
ncbi:inverse autotransporter beta domain-containing protein [Candidatus Neptunochlamydia vexilliferae]|uniref:inverse autotransporter beta domain-containing protein n=1 Tax=Candidatus Neptunichlamydia vexilliferae TaxID=1651774 RepID=UPI002A4E1367|nr:inverse autotransporter beta domain-containing protein [Candidatus Neptunochlamydia vexilliferae]